MKAKEISDQITAALKALGRGSRQSHRPSAQADFGVYTEDLRSVVRDFKRQLKSASGQQVHGLADELLKQQITECRQVAYELISSHAEARSQLGAKRLQVLGRGLDNWACVDLFCSNLSGPAWKDGQVTDERIFSWAASPDLWWRRVAVVSTVALNNRSKGGKGDTNRTLAVCQELVDDPEIMVQKAISWALRALVVWDPEAVEAFLTDHEEKVSKLVRREVLKRLRTGKKN